MTQLHFYRNKSAFNRAAFVKTIENRDVVKPAVSTSPTQLQLHRNTSVTPLPPTKPHSSRLSKSATLSSPPLRSRASASLVQLQLHRNTSAFDKAAFVKTIEDRDVKPAVTFQIFGLLGTTPTSPQHLRLRQSRICQNYRGPRCQARRHTQNVNSWTNEGFVDFLQVTFALSRQQTKSTPACNLLAVECSKHIEALLQNKQFDGELRGNSHLGYLIIHALVVMATQRKTALPHKPIVKLSSPSLAVSQQDKQGPATPAQALGVIHS
ncbi:hypothetical protein C1H76_4588 [Elsinoe australis]|uniref:Uncharacterized protein n=1 Tax=Elsinoe australis TaxID=40998 RepID=A0A4U7AY01_9PEZI|nr:hypothetical protein C1H76_4588 [Elsinoe australis]